MALKHLVRNVSSRISWMCVVMASLLWGQWDKPPSGDTGAELWPEVTSSPPEMSHRGGLVATHFARRPRSVTCCNLSHTL